MGVHPVLAAFAIVTGLFNRPLQAWADEEPASLGLAASHPR